MNMIIDSLGLMNDKEIDDEGLLSFNLVGGKGSEANENSGLRRDKLIEKVRGSIHTSLKASDSFSITYLDTKPERAKKAVQLLADHFIKTKLQLENERNTQTVDFFQTKLEELRETVEARETELMSKIGNDAQTTPRENSGLQRNLDEVETDLHELNLRIQKLQNRLQLVTEISNGDRGIEALDQLNTSELPSGEELNSLMSDYKEYANRYTSEFPKVKELKEQVFGMTNQIKSELEAIMFEMKAQKSFLENQQRVLAEKIEETILAEQRTNQSKTDFDIYRTLYDEMKVKLEQAKTTRDLGQKAKNQFVVIDPPIIPQKPAKPNRVLLAGGGIFLGLFLGVVAAAIAEFLDTTVRRPSDIKHFNKPVVAFIPETN
ncbi:hypothetical protein [Gracilimonas sp.]|uniref:GumC family protein n=1 Tax=Gracilimonas sp. TaxID=1974203 RepID=UPI0025B8953B|nr:hypothetical protein [Gracilimonas sp.]